MGRGVSSGGGQSSLGYLFGGGEAPKPGTNNAATPQNVAAAAAPVAGNVPAEKPAAAAAAAPPPAPAADGGKQVPARGPGSSTNNYFRADGQNCGNFLTDRPTTKVHAAPGGGSSLGYLFGGSGDGKSNTNG